MTRNSEQFSAMASTMGGLRALTVTLLVTLATAQPTGDARNDHISLVVDAVGNRLPPPAEVPSEVGSPSNLLHPDRYEFYTFDETGELVKRLMTLEEIRAIVASEDDEDGHLVTLAQASPDKPAIAFNFSHPPHIKVHSVVTNVQNVLKAEMEAQKNRPPNTHFLDTPDVSASWSAILPSIFGNTGMDIVPDRAPSAFGTPETDTLDTYITKVESITESTIVDLEQAKEEPVVEHDGLTVENSNSEVEEDISTTISIPHELTTPTTEATTTPKAITTPSTTVTQKTTTSKPKVTRKPPVRITTKIPPKKSTPSKVQATKAPTKTTKPKDDVAVGTKKPNPSTFVDKKPTTTNLKISTTTEIPTVNVQLVEIYNSNNQTQTKPMNTGTTTTEDPVTSKITKTAELLTSTGKPSDVISNSISAALPSAPITITTYRPILNIFASSQSTKPLGITEVEIKATNKPASISTDLPTPSSPTDSSNSDVDKFTKLDIIDPIRVTETNFASVPIVDNVLPPIFNVADSISQIASDLGNVFPTPGPNVGHDLGLEIKENVDISIPIDTKTEANETKTPTTTEVDPFTLSISTEEKLDSHDSDIYFVKLTTKNSSLTTGALTLKNVTSPSATSTSQITTESIIEKEPSSTYATTESYTETPLPSILELSASVTDLLSQVTNDAPLTMLEISDSISPTSETPINRNEDMDIVDTTIEPLEKNDENNNGKTEGEIMTTNEFVTTESYSTTENIEYLGSTATDGLDSESSYKSNTSEKETTKHTSESIYTTSEGGSTDETETSTLFSSTVFTEVSVYSDDVQDMLKSEMTTETILNDKNIPTGVLNETDTTTTSNTIFLTTLSEDLISQTDQPSEKNNSGERPTTESLKENKNVFNTKAAFTILDESSEEPNNVGISIINEGTPPSMIISSSILEDSSTERTRNPAVITTEKYSQTITNVTEKASTQRVSQGITNKVEAVNTSQDLSVSATSSPLPAKVTTEKIKTPMKVPTTIQSQTISPNLSLSTKSKINASISNDFVKQTTEASVDKEFVKPAKPKPDDTKKKVQKVNVDFKEHLGTSQNDSWKLISTVSPQKKYDNNFTGVNLGNISIKPLPHQKPKPTNDPNKQLNLDGSTENQGLESTTKNLEEDVYQFTELCNELAFRYWSAITNHNIDKKRSLVISPYAINSMLAMMFMGARGGTSGEMNEILKLDDMVTFNPHFTLKNISDSIEISKQSGVAASAFIRELYSDREKGKILAFYKERAHQFYNGHVEETNFKLINDIIRRRTNLLVKRHTWGKIPEYLKGNTISMQPPLAALSVNVFETDCSSSSSEGRDGEMYFVVSPSVRQRRLVPVPSAVYKKGFLAGYEPVLDATVAAVGTASAVISTIFVMPGQQGNSVQADDLDELQKRLLDASQTSDPWNRLLRTLLPRVGLELQIPRFSHRSVLNVSSTLKEMGLKDLFDPEEADLRGLNGLANDLYLSDMIHATTFATCGENIIGDLHHVESYPTEPARAKRSLWWFTPRQEMSSLSDGWDEPRDYQRAFHDPHDLGAMNMPLHLRPRQARLPQPTEAARLKFDRPFLFFVRHNPSGMILYMGRYNPRLLP